jgi:hypothetical protein
MEGSQKNFDVPLHASLDWTSTLSRGVMLRFISRSDVRMLPDPRLLHSKRESFGLTPFRYHRDQCPVSDSRG